MSVGRIALPFLAALPWHLDASRHGAVGAGQPDIHGAKRDAANGAVQTGTLVLAAALESLSALIHHASEHTGGSLSSWRKDKKKVTILFLRTDLLQKTAQKKAIQWLTCADSNASVDGGSEVTVEAFVWVTEVLLGAELAHLFGAHPAAAAAVQHQAHSWGALRWSGGARTLVAALLTCSLSTHRHTLSLTSSAYSVILHIQLGTQCLLRLEPLDQSLTSEKTQSIALILKFLSLKQGNIKFDLPCMRA